MLICDVCKDTKHINVVGELHPCPKCVWGKRKAQIKQWLKIVEHAPQEQIHVKKSLLNKDLRVRAGSWVAAELCLIYMQLNYSITKSMAGQIMISSVQEPRDGYYDEFVEPHILIVDVESPLGRRTGALVFHLMEVANLRQAEQRPTLWLHNGIFMRESHISDDFRGFADYLQGLEEI